MFVYFFIDDKLSSFNLDSYDKKVITFGRSSDCDICLNRDYISRKHGCFYIKEGIWYIKDLKSTNGIFYENKKLTEEIPISGKSFRIYNTDGQVGRIKIIADSQNIGAIMRANNNPFRYGTNKVVVNEEITSEDGKKKLDLKKPAIIASVIIALASVGIVFKHRSKK